MSSQWEIRKVIVFYRSVECGTNMYNSNLAVAIAMVIIFVFGLPLGSLAYLFYKRKEIFAQVDIRELRLLYEGYRVKVYWW